ncbi:MAG: hypothetical protein ABIH70_07620 [Chloroflexota bacterium]
MDWGLFGLGMVGALVTVYLSKDEIIPEFRAIFDTSEIEKGCSELLEKNKKTRKEIDDAQAKLLKNPSPDEKESLNTYIGTSQEELREDTKRLQKLENEMMWSQIWRKGVGILVYIVLGGVFGALLADWVKIEGTTGALPRVLVAVVVGAGWTGYLSAIGLKSLSKKTDEAIQNNQKDASQTIAELKKAVEELAKKITEQSAKPAAAAGRGTVAQPEVEPITISQLVENFRKDADNADIALQSKFDLTRRQVQRGLKGIL